MRTLHLKHDKRNALLANKRVFEEICDILDALDNGDKMPFDIYEPEQWESMKEDLELIRDVLKAMEEK